MRIYPVHVKHVTTIPVTYEEGDNETGMLFMRYVTIKQPRRVTRWRYTPF